MVSTTHLLQFSLASDLYSGWKKTGRSSIYSVYTMSDVCCFFYSIAAAIIWYWDGSRSYIVANRSRILYTFVCCFANRDKRNDDDDDDGGAGFELVVVI